MKLKRKEDNKGDMTLTEFKRMWQEDGTKLVQQSRKILNGSTWLLFAVYFPDSTYDYGRHMAMILKVDKTTGEILKHDLKNLSGEVEHYGKQGIDSWFKEHAGKY